MRWWLVLTTLATIGCSERGRSCGGKFLILWPDAGGSYAPRVVETHSLGNPNVLSGPAARVYFESRPGSTSGFAGKPAEPHLTVADDVCVPTDAGSALAVSAYAQFEKIQDFDRRLGVADHLSWPRDVGVETHLSGAPEATENNAHYVGAKDIVMLVPTTMPNVPVALNLGVLAHEHFHAHFQSQVLNALVTVAPTISTELITPSLQPRRMSTAEQIRMANEYIMRGWNEGLADLYAGVYLNQPDFLSASFGKNPIAEFRKLDGEPALIGNYEALDRIKTSQFDPSAEAETMKWLAGLTYTQGTALSRALWAMLGADHPNDREQTLAIIMKSLRKLPERLADKVNAAELDHGFVLSTLLENVTLSATTCQNLRAVLRSSAAFGRISQCGYH